MTLPRSVLVVGGGVIGLLTAHSLASAGCKVTLCERGPGALEASWAGGGILAPLQPWDSPPLLEPLLRYSQAAYPQLAASLLAHTGVDPEWILSGALMLGVEHDPAAKAGVDKSDTPGHWLTPDELRRHEPEVRKGSALRLPNVAQVRNPRLIRALYARLRQLGVSLCLETEVQGIDSRGERVTAVRLADSKLAADAVVVTAGAWSAGLIESTGLRLPVEPVKGQMLLFRGPPGLIRHIVLGRTAYLVPRRDGRILVGSTVEHVGFDKRPTETARGELCAAATALMPAAGKLPLEAHWAGLRPGSPDELPYIGRHPALRNLYVNTGHYRLGLTLAPGSADLLADLILDRPLRFDPTPFRVDRPKLAV